MLVQPLAIRSYPVRQPIEVPSIALGPGTWQVPDFLQFAPIASAGGRVSGGIDCEFGRWVLREMIPVDVFPLDLSDHTGPIGSGNLLFRRSLLSRQGTGRINELLRHVSPQPKRRPNGRIHEDPSRKHRNQDFVVPSSDKHGGPLRELTNRQTTLQSSQQVVGVPADSRGSSKAISRAAP